jgi:hypothetical protein
MTAQKEVLSQFVGDLQVKDFVYRSSDQWGFHYTSGGFHEVKTAHKTHGFLKGVRSFELTPEGKASFFAHTSKMGIERARVFVVNGTRYEDVPDWQTDCTFYSQGRLLVATDDDGYRCAVYTASDANMQLCQPKHFTVAPNGDLWFTARSGGRKYVFRNGWPVAGPYSVIGDLQIVLRRTYGVVFNTHTHSAPHWYVNVFPHEEPLGPYCEVKRLHLFNGSQFAFRARTPDGWCLIQHRTSGLSISDTHPFIFPLRFTKTHAPVCRIREDDGMWVLVGSRTFGPFDSVTDPVVEGSAVSFGTVVDGKVCHISVSAT